MLVEGVISQDFTGFSKEEEDGESDSDSEEEWPCKKSKAKALELKKNLAKIPKFVSQPVSTEIDASAESEGMERQTVNSMYVEKKTEY